jgi:hypothetical protein
MVMREIIAKYFSNPYILKCCNSGLFINYNTFRGGAHFFALVIRKFLGLFITIYAYVSCDFNHIPNALAVQSLCAK